MATVSFKIAKFATGIVCVAGLWAMAQNAAATPKLPTGEKAITLIANDGGRQTIGRVTFSPDGDGAKIAVKLDSPDFTNEFLSMRPFRCLSPKARMWCHLEYPYETQERVTPTDLMDLEYALMFIWRYYNRVGADAWNGLYFKLAAQPDGAIIGDLHEADFNALASPPKTPFARLVGHADLTPAQPGAQVWDRVEIK
jgi:hypothetical protein